MFSFLLQENPFLKDIMAAADWCRNTFDAGVDIPSVLFMDKEEQVQALKKLNSWTGELDENSPAEVFTFVFKNKRTLKSSALNLEIKKSTDFSPDFCSSD